MKRWDNVIDKKEEQEENIPQYVPAMVFGTWGFKITVIAIYQKIYKNIDKHIKKIPNVNRILKSIKKSNGHS